MVKRHASSAFGSTYAFPGGVLEPSDSLVHANCRGISADAANQLLGLSDGALDYYSAAIRELFEESGVLLADHELAADQLAAARDELNACACQWHEFVLDNAVQLRCDRLHYFSYWITPVGLPKRYSARFFLATVDAGQQARHDGSELVKSRWMPAADVLAARRKKQMKVPYPTRKTLKQLAKLDSTDALERWARACGKKGVVCDQPAFAPKEIA